MSAEPDALRMMLDHVAAELKLERATVDRLEIILRTRWGGERVYIARRVTLARLADPALLPSLPSLRPVSTRHVRRLKKRKS